MNTQVKGSKRNRLAGIFVMFFAMMVFLVPKAQAADVTGTVEKQMSTNEAPVIEATGTPSFGTEDWVGPQEQGPVVVMETPSFGPEDWVGPQEQGPAVAMISPSFGTEDWIGPEEQAPVVAVQPPSFGTEDWIGPEEQAPIVAVKSPSLGTEDWTGTMESSEAVGTGAIPEPAPENLDLDDYNPD